MDLNKLTVSDKVIAGSGIVLFIAYFLPWFKVDFPFSGAGSVTASGSDVGFLWATLPMLIGLVLAGLVIATKLFDVKMPTLPVPMSQFFLGLGTLAALLVVLKLIIGEDPSELVKRAFGLFLATLAALGLAAGGFLKLKEGDDALPAAPPPPGNAPF
ncbi:MAG: hypothetical protein EXQ71_05740 [Acidimicrobiia bacterium]|nr:hypothetical protein [Acidimicrobiia bacterium]